MILESAHPLMIMDILEVPLRMKQSLIRAHQCRHAKNACISLVDPILEPKYTKMRYSELGLLYPQGTIP